MLSKVLVTWGAALACPASAFVPSQGLQHSPELRATTAVGASDEAAPQDSRSGLGATATAAGLCLAAAGAVAAKKRSARTQRRYTT
eukprot:CAMPEP_0177340062 /NCGR_PEP_ID=MMETSP0368-20130122/25745_1 /TAXON_ID=447022 ORGANISM="Scrippsiella hangoei-like, Strain SHHI-4" /NCGR_SAMPLE_ID=MMETSP0368 /ASSEMBLY_ACC=CAM_ASM_000363 /LENGTH=85 /DNA_ID=CAMNT_0018801209 /DNA_START=68 /DNA_END=321 /DNA_ORIENTATION=+